MLKKARMERLIWLDIMITLLALELMAYFYYGIRAVLLGGVCAAVSLAADIASQRLMHRPFTADDLTSTSDGLILALMLPATFDHGIAALGCVFAVVIAKNVFGGRHNMIFSPAAAAYIFLLTSWGRDVLLFPSPHTRTGIFEKPEELVQSAAHTFNVSGKMDYTDFELLMGNFSGPCGAVSVLLLIVAAAMLIFRRDISAGAFVGTLFGTGLFAYITPASFTRWDSVKYSLINNMVLFAAVYITSDRRIAPRRNIYAFFYGLAVGVVSYIIVLTTAKENAVIMVSVLLTPIALGLRNLEDSIDRMRAEAETVPEVSEEEPEIESEAMESGDTAEAEVLEPAAADIPETDETSAEDTDAGDAAVTADDELVDENAAGEEQDDE